MLRDEEAVVVDTKPFNLHGVHYQDVTITYPDRSFDHARLGPESVPENLQPSEVVLAMKVSNMVVSHRRTSEPNEAEGAS
jgi:hypothetical protein